MTVSESSALPLPAAQTEKILSVSNIEVIYDHIILVLKGVSLDVPKGSIVALLGANGAGKTSLLRLLAGFLAPHAGRVLVKTGDTESDDAEERGRLVGWLGHLDGLKPQLTVFEQLRFFAHLYGREADRAVLDTVGLGGARADLMARTRAALTGADIHPPVTLSQAVPPRPA